MKFLKNTYVLVVAVVIIWGIIGYNLYNFVKSDDVSVQVRKDNVPVTHADSVIRYTLLANYRDPFLTSAVKTLHQSNKEISPRKVNVIVQEVHTIEWPKLQYKGLVENSQARKKIALININGIGSLVKEGDMLGAVRVHKIWKDSLELRVDRASRVVQRQ
jgi:hypothetical protein